MLAASPFEVEEDGVRIEGKRVLAVEDGPTLTHGEMTFGAGGARRAGRTAPPSWSIRARSRSVRSPTAFEAYPHVGALLPAMGYGRAQMEDLRETIARSDAEVVLIGTPIDLRRLIHFDKPALRVTYRLQEIGEETLADALADAGIIPSPTLV